MSKVGIDLLHYKSLEATRYEHERSGIDVSKIKVWLPSLRPLNIILFEIMEKQSNTYTQNHPGLILFIHV